MTMNLRRLLKGIMKKILLIKIEEMLIEDDGFREDCWHHGRQFANGSLGKVGVINDGSNHCLLTKTKKKDLYKTIKKAKEIFVETTL